MWISKESNSTKQKHMGYFCLVLCWSPLKSGFERCFFFFYLPLSLAHSHSFELCLQKYWPPWMIRRIFFFPQFTSNFMNKKWFHWNSCLHFSFDEVFFVYSLCYSCECVIVFSFSLMCVVVGCFFLSMCSFSVGGCFYVILFERVKLFFFW